MKTYTQRKVIYKFFLAKVFNENMMRDTFMGQVLATLPNPGDGGERRTMRLMNRGRHAETEVEGKITFNVTHQADLRAT